MGSKVQSLLSPSYIIQGSSTENKDQMSVKIKVGEGKKDTTSPSIVQRLMSFFVSLDQAVSQLKWCRVRKIYQHLANMVL